MRSPPGSFDDPTATLVRGPERPRPLGVVLRVTGVDARPPVLRVSRGKCVLGSAPTCDVVIPERTVSRAHCEIELAPEGVVVRDLGSRNGTFYLGQRIEAMMLSVGGAIVLGGSARVAIELDTRELDAVPPAELVEYRGVVGVSPAMRRLFGLLTRLEGSLVTVLVEGESGVGKEVVARALHEGSRVAAGPFVAVNCGAIPRELVASELFGHKRGAFTGAVEARRGAFDAADGGTLFLDELGELPLEVQPMLLRALESGEIRAVGDDHTRNVKVRVVAATHRDLEQAVREGRFREDLFYRLAVVRLTIPPLRERPEDVELLARRFAAAEGLPELTDEIVERLRARPFPGNARELRNVVQAFGAIGVVPEGSRGSESALRAALAQAIDLSRPFADQRDAIADEFTRIYLRALLAHTGGNQTLAAKVAGLDRTYFGRLLAKHGLTRA